MTISSILNEKGRDIVRVTPADTIGTVVRRLGEHRIGAVMVIDAAAPRTNVQARHILGIVSERDIVRALSRADGAGDVLDMTAAQIMTEARYTISPSASLAEAAVLMTDRRVRHLPVLENEVMVGLVSIGDVVKGRLEQQDNEVNSLRAYVIGAH